MAANDVQTGKTVPQDVSTFVARTPTPLPTNPRAEYTVLRVFLYLMGVTSGAMAITGKADASCAGWVATAVCLAGLACSARRY